MTTLANRCLEFLAVILTKCSVKARDYILPTVEKGPHGVTMFASQASLDVTASCDSFPLSSGA